MKNTIRQIIVILSVIATITVNILANAIPLNGLNTGEISDRFKVYFVPAGYVFLIWGLIYVGLIAYAIFQALPSQKENPRLQRTGYLLAASGLANIAWLFFWHYQLFPLTIVAMGILLGLLITIYVRLGIGKTPGTTAETWAVRIPISVYLGWITVATIANITDLLYYWNWNGFGLSPEIWMLLILMAVFVIASLVSLTRRDLAYNLVIIWALIGITAKHSNVALIAAASLVTAICVAAVMIYGYTRGKNAQSLA